MKSARRTLLGCSALAFASFVAAPAWASTTTYAYDVLGRVTAATTTNAAQNRTTTYAYDKADNRSAVNSTVKSFRIYATPLGGSRVIVVP